MCFCIPSVITNMEFARSNTDTKMWLIPNTVEHVYIEHSGEMKKRSMHAGVQYIQVMSIWRSGEIESKSKVNR